MRRTDLRDHPANKANGDRLKALLRSCAEARHFYSVAMQLAAHEARQGHGKLAEELREPIERREVAPQRRQRRLRYGLSARKGELSALLNVIYPDRRLSDLVWAEPLKLTLQRVLKELRRLGKLSTTWSSTLHRRRTTYAPC